MKPIPVRNSIVVPAFGQPGFGLLYKTPVNVNTLIKRGFIVPIN